MPEFMPLPAAIIVPFAGAADRIPDGWALCDGREVSGEDPRYARLYDAIGTAWGSPGKPRFHLPDLRGVFLRGVSAGTDKDPHASERTRLYPGGNAGNAVGSYQEDALAQHDHPVGPLNVGHTVNGGGSAHRIDSDDGGSWHDVNITQIAVSRPEWARETRPKNVLVNFIVKL